MRFNTILMNEYSSFILFILINAVECYHNIASRLRPVAQLDDGYAMKMVFICRCLVDFILYGAFTQVRGLIFCIGSLGTRRSDISKLLIKSIRR